MSIRKNENDLFDEWKKERPNRRPFVKDGVVDESAYKKDKIKTAFVLKEYAHPYSDYDLREQELTRYGYRIWINVANTLHKIRTLSGDVQGELGRKMPESICAFNLDKSGGHQYTAMVQLALIAMEDREFIKEQLNIYRPRLIICCGTFNIFRYVFGVVGKNVNDGIEYTSTHNFRWCKIDSESYAVDAYHPSYPGWGNDYTDQLIKAIDEIEDGAVRRV